MARKAFDRDAKRKFDKLLDIYAEPKLTGNVSHEPLVDRADATAQWANFCNVMENCKEDAYKRLRAGEFWATQLTHELLVQTFSAVAILVQIMLLIPIGSVENERCFSLMNLLKNELRNRLDENHLNCAVRVKRCRFGLSTFPVDAALSHWNQQDQRRFD